MAAAHAPPGAAGEPPQHGPPYPPQTQSLGEVPSIVPDVPVNVIFLLLFVGAGVGHMVLFQRNKNAGKKFVFSALVFGFCITRIIATILRIAWACHPTNLHVGITATVFIYAGIVLLFLANLFFAQRIVRAQHPTVGWSKPFSIPFPILIVTTVGTILCLIAAVIVRFYTIKPFSQHAAGEIQKYGATWLAIFAFVPILIVSISSLARRHPKIRMTKTTDKFGEGSMRAKVAIVLVSGFLLCLGASYRAGTTLANPVPIFLPTNPPTPAPEPGYLSKACFYIFNFTIEICVCYFWLAVRIDKRFYIPDGAKGPFSYAGGFVFAGEFGNEKKRISHGPASPQDLNRTPSTYSQTSLAGRLSRASAGSLRQIETRVSWGGPSAASLSKLEKRISWGGVSQEAVEDGIRENGSVDGHTAADVGVEGMEKEMGWDPKSGKWALRPISSASRVHSRPASYASSAQ